MFSSILKSIFSSSQKAGKETYYAPQPERAYETYELSYMAIDAQSGKRLQRQAKIVLIGNIVYTDDHSVAEILIEAQRFRDYGAQGKPLSENVEKILNQAEAIIMTKPIDDYVSDTVFGHLIEGEHQKIIDIVNSKEENFSPELGFLKTIRLVFSETTPPGKKTRNTDIHTDRFPAHGDSRGTFVIVPLADKDKECGTVLFTGPNAIHVANSSEKQALREKDHIQITSVPIGHQAVLLTSTARNGDGTYHCAKQSIDGMRAVQNRFYHAGDVLIIGLEAEMIDWNQSPQAMDILVENALETPYNNFEDIDLPPSLQAIRDKVLQERARISAIYEEPAANAA